MKHGKYNKEIEMIIKTFDKRFEVDIVVEFMIFKGKGERFREF